MAYSLYLKTSNVLITDRYEVKLADFGLARSLDSSFIGRVGNNE
jgi:serine/threonine protein kinase